MIARRTPRCRIGPGLVVHRSEARRSTPRKCDWLGCAHRLFTRRARCTCLPVGGVRRGASLRPIASHATPGSMMAARACACALRGKLAPRRR
eukprot:scaffold1915_cov288-Prasinococcus_capsulatus_cf.AAC.12